MKEIWKDVKGYEGFYQISNLGRVKSLSRVLKTNPRRHGDTTQRIKEKILRQSNNKNVYKRVYLYKESKKCTLYVHRLVAITFIDNLENKSEINHINGIKSDNMVENLEWCTKGENLKHAFATGLRNSSGENHPQAKLNESQVRGIRILLKYSTLLQKEIAEIYKVGKNAIYLIKSGRRWKEAD